MARKKEADRVDRLQIMLAPEELAALDNWRFEKRMPSRAAAVRELLRLGLADQNTSTAKPASSRAVMASRKRSERALSPIFAPRQRPTREEERTMQAKCPKCEATAFRMLPESVNATEVECLTCGHVASFVSTVAPQASAVDRPASRG
jgi:Zn ribbon nucleic-acid-binding protein